MNSLSASKDAWGIAIDFLSEASSISADTRPLMATHASYYAMFHAARAVLVTLDGSAAPTKHSAVVSRFGFHANRENNDAWKLAGRWLKKTHELRIKSDYNETDRPEPREASEAVGTARQFVEFCANLLEFPMP